MVINNFGEDNYSKIREVINNVWEDPRDLTSRNHASEGILADLLWKILVDHFGGNLVNHVSEIMADHLGEILVDHISETLVNHRGMN